ncbi:MAG: type I restriction enzyme HsdR N-terminal domain-containing protein [Lentimicrobium sp.]|jgi:hypothetical protein|nr:type I restriction enzyme HsdR N-terminal domain-containing protein [Lentimicrobium sp.]
MLALKFPEYSFKTAQKAGQTSIFDPLRKRYVLLTPEEWVRQHLIRYLVEEKNVPSTLIASEKGVQVNGLKQRFDLLVFTKDGNPLMICECKSPDVRLSEDTFHQAIRYNLTLKAHYLLISNGLHHHVAFIDYENVQLKYLPHIPTYTEMNERI